MKIHDLVILGTGFGGIGMALRLLAEGHTDFLVLEKAAGVGGTWRDNIYPGAACDVPSHLYWFSFTEQPEWSKSYSDQPEILHNFERLVDKSGLAPHLRFNTEVVQAQWDEHQLHWRIRTASNETLLARHFVAAWGQLNRPSFASIEGRTEFEGALFHSASWQHDVALEGKRVACIGNGPSAVQFIPELARKAAQLTVFQRSPNYLVPRLDRPYTQDEQRIFRALPAKRDASRQAVYDEHEAWYPAFIRGSAAAAEFTAVARAQLESQVADPVLREKLWPNYDIGCKRIVICDDYYPALTRPNVALETEGIEAIEAKGIRTRDGRLHEFDVIVFGTGFETRSLLGVADILGRGGKSLRETWQPVPEAYLGIAVAGFPNLHLLYGPNTNLGHNSILLMVECQIEYVLKALRTAREHGVAAFDVKPAVMSDYNRQLQEDLGVTAWAGDCGSWYKHDGRISNNYSSSVEHYKQRTAVFEISNYEAMREAEIASA